MSEIKRYDFSGDYLFDEETNGDFVWYDDHAAALAAKDERIAELERNRCDLCGAKVSDHSMGCPGCGAPVCCQWCCKRANAEADRDSAREEIERLREVLERLARLGNGDKYGNSEGNMIARAALTKEDPK